MRLPHLHNTLGVGHADVLLRVSGLSTTQNIHTDNCWHLFLHFASLVHVGVLFFVFFFLKKKELEEHRNVVAFLNL